MYSLVHGLLRLLVRSVSAVVRPERLGLSLLSLVAVRERPQGARKARRDFHPAPHAVAQQWPRRAHAAGPRVSQHGVRQQAA